MKIHIPRCTGRIGIGEDDDMIPKVESKTIDLYEKFHEFIAELEHDGYKVRKIVLHSNLYGAIKRSDEYRKTVAYTYDNGEPEYETFLGVKIEPKQLGRESITDFIIYTDRKVVHSEMLEKTFLEDVDDKQLVDNLEVEELIHETNQRVEDRDDNSKST